MFGLFQAIFMANAGGAWDNAKKIVETELKMKGTAAARRLGRGRHRGRPFKDTSSVAMNPVIKFTTLFGLLAVELGVYLHRRRLGDPDPGAGGGVLPDLAAVRLPLVLRHADRGRSLGRGRTPAGRLAVKVVGQRMASQQCRRRVASALRLRA